MKIKSYVFLKTYLSAAECMTPNRADAPAMKGKRLRSLLEEHKKSGRATFSFENSLMILIIICTYVLFNFF